MRSLTFLVVFSTYCLAATVEPQPRGFSTTLPLTRRAGYNLRRLRKKQVASSAIGLGDDFDTQYSVQMNLGGTGSLPIIVDTGSSDLMAMSNECTPDTCGTIDGVQLVPVSSFTTTGQDFRVDYGDSSAPTFASGHIVSGSASLADFSVENQFMGAVNNTNAFDDDMTGIIGLSFPGLSRIYNELLGNESTTDDLISKLAQQGPLISRLIANGQLAEPMVTITLQRDTVEIGGNIGQLDIGRLPGGVTNSSLTWVPVRLYSTDQGGAAPPSDAPNEIYPIGWEIPLDDVLLNGQPLPKPTDIPFGYSALIDSGTSGLLGPEATVKTIYNALSTDFANFDSSDGPQVPCNTSIQLAFVFGGTQFPIDPRDYFGNLDVNNCNLGKIGETDPPKPGNLLSWIIGDPFFKSNLIAFYYGDLAHPSNDPPRIGFLSTVPTTAASALSADIAGAVSTGIQGTSEAPPPGTFSPAGTNSVGVGQAPVPTGNGTSTNNNGASRPGFSLHWVLVAVLGMVTFA